MSRAFLILAQLFATPAGSMHLRVPQPVVSLSQNTGNSAPLPVDASAGSGNRWFRFAQPRLISRPCRVTSVDSAGK